ncbi:sensor histidine kinase [Actinorugispora endophytica]|uniref:histidine kinase n=1 Tax=Actinorugispora endophytica TaxID=1605990 RepID=A0A4R6VDT6_9ACTN|nr:histidine kinase [Actinorugispora endophytica]TDQ55177.1 signal transduction histidine kinase [Actinorugispora endophytica]
METTVTARRSTLRRALARGAAPSGRSAGRGLLLAGFVLAAALDSLTPFTTTQPVSPFAPLMAVPAYLIGWSPPTGRGARLCLTGVLLGQPAAALLLWEGATPAFLKGAVAVLFALLPWLVGRYRRQRAEAAGLGWRRAELLEREQEVAAERERLRERARIAARMHDSLGHELSLIAVRAGALEVAEDLGAEDYRRGAAELGAGAIGAVERLQEIIGLLHDDRPPDDAEPWHEDLRALVEHARASAMAVELDGGGLWHDLSQTTRAALYTVVRESLTNAAKHAPGAAVAVRLSRNPDVRGGVVARVVNGPATGPPKSARASGGRGLAALRERVRADGGSLASGPRPDGGFEVIARLPPNDGAAPLGKGAPSESERQRAATRQRANRGLVTAIAVPLGLLAALVLAWGGYYGHTSARSVLAPEAFASLRVGDGQERVEAVLPPTQMIDPPSAAGPPVSGAWTCSYYRSRVAWPGTLANAYRLCFADGRLVGKDTVPLGARQETDR